MNTSNEMKLISVLDSESQNIAEFNAIKPKIDALSPLNESSISPWKNLDLENKVFSTYHPKLLKKSPKPSKIPLSQVSESKPILIQDFSSPQIASPIIHRKTQLRRKHTTRSLSIDEEIANYLAKPAKHLQTPSRNSPEILKWNNTDNLKIGERTPQNFNKIGERSPQSFNKLPPLEVNKINTQQNYQKFFTNSQAFNKPQTNYRVHSLAQLINLSKREWEFMMTKRENGGIPESYMFQVPWKYQRGGKKNFLE
ncbi:unnamed protein product [Blepharisma stoltei]|uniref:Uncharacterized protein n=1 Tax=Blepharisma stoltei TaxID=1481888 RepID=A0AAU9ISR9_9CILI|nr:unnamed protein product [Blepharisma stoltei]